MEEFDTDREAVISRAAEVGVSRIVCPGTDIASSQRGLDLADRYPDIVASVGIHPHDARALSDEEIASLEELARHPKAVAIGEIGLDFHHDYTPREVQQVAFRQQLDLAARSGLPVIIHCREAEEVMLPLLAEWTAATRPPTEGRRGVIHCFQADGDALGEYLAMGFMIALGGYITYSTEIVAAEVIRRIPDARLLVETDCPFQTPQRLRGRRNEPALIVDTVTALAEIRKTTFDDIAAMTTRNARRLFWPEDIP